MRVTFIHRLPLLVALAAFLTKPPKGAFFSQAAAAVGTEGIPPVETEADPDVINSSFNEKNLKAEFRRRERTAEERYQLKKKLDARRGRKNKEEVELDPEFLKERRKTMPTSDEKLEARFQKRLLKKKARLEEMHQEVVEKINSHHEGRELLSDEEYEKHEKKRNALEKKRNSMDSEDSAKYMERMRRHEKKLLERLEKKRRRRDERLSRTRDEF